MDDAMKTKIDNLIVEKMADIKIAGLSLQILKDGNIEYVQNYGGRDLDKILPVDADTLFNIASTTKSFICCAILKLYEQGKLALDDAVSQYVPLKLGSDDNPITIHHLMTHTSGIPDLSGHVFTYDVAKIGLPVALYSKLITIASKDDLYRLMNAGSEYVKEPGEYFYYNNFCYAILADIIERITGGSYTEFIDKEIFKPLHMHRTAFYQDLEEPDNKSKGYINKPQGEDKGSTTTEVDYVQSIPIREAAGGIFSSTNDMVNYMKMMLNNGEFEGKQLLKPSSVALMQKNHLAKGTYARKLFDNLLDGGGYGYGLFIEEDFYGYKMIRHGGNFIGSTADFLFVPELNYGIISLANNAAGPRQTIRNILAMLLGHDLGEDVIEEVERKHLESLTGIYETYNTGSRMEVKTRGAYVVIESKFQGLLPSPPLVLYPLDDEEIKPMEFVIRNFGNRKMIVYFEKTEDEQLWLNVDRNRYKKTRDLDT